MLGPESGCFRRFGLVGGGVSVRAWLKMLTLAAWKSVFHKQLSDKDVEL